MTRSIRAIDCVAVSLGSVVFAGCGGGGGGGGGGAGLAVDPLPLASMSAQGTGPAAALAVQASLAVMDPAHFAPLAGSAPQLGVTGTTTAGTVTLDFGAGTVVNDATYVGRVVSTWSGASVSGSAGQATLTVDLSGLSFTTASLGPTACSGAFVFSPLTWNGVSRSVTANGSSGSAVVLTSGAGPFECRGPSFSWTYSAGDTITITSEDDDWISVTFPDDNGRVELTDVVVSRSGSVRTLTAGSIYVARSGVALLSGQSGVQAVYTISGANGGVFQVTPFGGAFPLSLGAALAFAF